MPGTAWERKLAVTKPLAKLDIFSPEACLDEAEVARRCAALRQQEPVLWVEQEPYRPFWAVLRQSEIKRVERDSKTWIA